MLRDDLFPFQFIKKSRFTGSYEGMFYRIEQAEKILPAEPAEDSPEHPAADSQEKPAEEKEQKIKILTASVFPGPYAFEYTNKELIVSAEFPFSEEGYEQVKDWLEEQAAGRDWKRRD